MRRLRWMLVMFAIMYVAATSLGVASYSLLSPTAMWVTVFTLMPVICALLIWWYLATIRCSAQRSARATVEIVAVWIALSFAFDALTYIWIVPRASHGAPNWRFFMDQSPWIWLSYVVLSVSGYAARRLYLRKTGA